jgi:SAM-dependent methyltransferase
MKPAIEDIRAYWNANPLLSHELTDSGSPEFFAALNRAKCEDSDRFALGYWGFHRYAGQNVLDIGCGPGWLTVQYAKGGAHIRSIDLTPRAVELAKAHLALHGLTGDVREGNAEALPFPDASFDLVVASGVLHHTSDTQQAFREAFRVTRPGGEGLITLYRKGFLHHPAVFTATRLIMKVLGVRHPGADLGRNAADVDDFIRRYDGDDNPVGIGKTNHEWTAELNQAGWQVVEIENHFFPRRFLAMPSLMPDWLHRFLDARFGTMAYFRLHKPNNWPTEKRQAGLTP